MIAALSVFCQVKDDIMNHSLSNRKTVQLLTRTEVSWILIDYIGFSLSISIKTTKLIDYNRLKMDYNCYFLSNKIPL